MLMGVDGPGGIWFDDFDAAYALGSLALAVILFSGGLEMPARTVASVAAPAITLATLGVVLTAGLIGAAAAPILGLSMVSSVAGIVVGVVNSVSSDLSFFGIKVFPAVILGGLDSIIGAVVGGIIIGLLEHFAVYVDLYAGIGNLQQIVPFYVLVIILMIKPYGLFGTRDIERV